MVMQFRVPSASQHNFSEVPNAEIQRSKFDRSHNHKTTFDAGYLVPIFADEALPGDTFSLDISAIARFATPIFPLMDNMYLDFFFFAIPRRLTWNNWEKFNGAQADPGDSTDFLEPQMVSPTVGGGYASETLSDYLGIPILVPNLAFNSHFHRSYNLVYNEWFRDQNLQDSVVVDKDDGPDDTADYVLLKRGKRHDYFTSALPFPQKGPSVPLPLTGNAQVINDPAINVIRLQGGSGGLGAMGYHATNDELFVGAKSGTWTNLTGVKLADDGLGTGLLADLSSVTAATINELRQAFQIQKIYERDARGGTRYTEIIRSHFGVVSPDARLQRPEYLGGGSVPIIINPIAQTSSSDATTPQGNLSAIGTAVVKRIGFTKSFTEHSTILGIVCARADLTYQQGLPRMFSRRTRFDHYWPALSHIGEQSILNKEIFAQDDTVAGDLGNLGTWAYQERYAEYRYYPSMITGKFRSDDPQTLDAWHLAQDFPSLPAFNDDFIVENPPVDRVIAVTTEPHFIYDSYVRYICARPMSTYGVPGLIDHF